MFTVSDVAGSIAKQAWYVPTVPILSVSKFRIVSVNALFHNKKS